MGRVDEEETILGSRHVMELPRFHSYSLESAFRQKIHYKPASVLERSANKLVGSEVLDVS